MEFKIKHFFIMNQVFIFVSGVAFNKVFSANIIDIRLIAYTSLLLIGLIGSYVSFKGLFLLFSRDYKKVIK